MIEELNGLIKEALKSKQKERLNALRYLKSLLMENKTSTKPIEEMDVVIRHHKKLTDSLVNFPEDNPMHAQTVGEIAIIAEFLPKQLTEDEVKELIQGIKDKLDNPNMGAIMKELSPQIKGKFNGKQASDLVKAALA
jgi:uncharacterized protein YqeY